jgi:hypothetical protein
MASRHRSADLQGLEIWVRFAANGESITDISGGAFQDADVTLTDTGAGDYILTINPFKGPRGKVWGTATVQTISMFASLTAFTYTGESLAVTIKVENDASTASDAIVNVHLYAE